MTFWILMLLAIALQAAGQVLQKHRVAIRVPGVTLGSVLRRPLAFFGVLVRDPLWMISHMCNGAGAILGIQLISRVDLTVFKSLWELQVLMVVAAGALLLRERLTRVEIFGILVMTAGTVLLAATGVEVSGSTATTAMNLAVVGCAVGALGLLALAARRWPKRLTAELTLALAVGVLYGCGSVLTKGATGLVKAELGHFSLLDRATLAALLRQIEFGLAVLTVGIGIVLLQTAFSVGRVSVVAPLTLIGGLLLPILVGFVLLGERLDLARAAAVMAMGSGTVLLGLRQLPPRAR